MAESMVAEVVVGVDTHADVHVAVALSGLGEHLGAFQVPTTPTGFDKLERWAGHLGRIRSFGIEGIGSYGAALARHLRSR